MPEIKRCFGVKTTGYWKGHPCGAAPVIAKDGRWWCKNHVPINGLLRKIVSKSKRREPSDV